MLNIDLKQTTTFLKALDENLKSFTFQVFHDSDKTRKDEARHFQADTAGSTASKRLVNYNNDGFGVFVQPNGMDQSKRKRLSNYVNKIRAVWVDLDNLEESPIDPVLECTLKPHIIIESSPGKWHAYWLVEYGFDIDLFVPVQKTIYKRFNGDSSMAELNRVMRLPGFYHQKKEPLMTQLRTLEEFPRYTQEQILKEFPPTVESKKTKKEKLPEKMISGEQHNTLLKLSVALKKDYGITENELCKILPVIAKERGHRIPEANELEDIVAWTEDNIEDDPVILNDYYIARHMQENHGHTLKHCSETDSFLYWDRSRWVEDTSLVYTTNVARDTIFSFIDRMNISKKAVETQYIKEQTKIKNVREVMRSYKYLRGGVSMRYSDFDVNPYLLNVKNGTIDLRTGEIRQHRSSDFITREININYNPEADCPKWKKFLSEILPDSTIRDYLHVVEGYCTTGITTEQKFWIYYGSGGNGKSLFINTLKAVRGPYATIAMSDVFAAKKFSGEGPTPGLKELKGFRDIVINETSKGFEFDGQILKNFVDAETALKARGMRENNIEYIPDGKLRFITNVKPRMKVDGGFERRVSYVPFTVQIPKEQRNKNLFTELREEWEGILNWLVQGAIRYFSKGLNEPKAVLESTEEYLDEMDSIRQFMKDCVIKAEGMKAPPKQLYDTYKSWTSYAGEKYTASNRVFKQFIEEQGFEQEKTHEGRYWQGIGIVEELPFEHNETF